MRTRKGPAHTHIYIVLDHFGVQEMYFVDGYVQQFASTLWLIYLNYSNVDTYE